jgi:uncharacterized protein YkwD
LWICVSAAWLLGCGCCAFEPAIADEGATKLTPAEAKQLEQLMVDFRSARANATRRAGLIDQATKLGIPAVKALQGIVEKEMQVPLKEYHDKLTRAAEEAVAARNKSAKPGDVEAWRKRILELAADENLTKEQIVAEIDPLLAKLRELAILDRAAVLKHLPDAGKRRAALLTQGKVWDHCQKALASAVTEESQERLPLETFEDRLTREEEALAFLTLAADNASRTVLRENASLAAALDEQEAQCILELNVVRMLLRLPVLAIDPALCKAARDHSSDMARLEFFDHESPVEGKRTPSDRARLAGTTGGAENIAQGTTLGSEANRIWWHSPGHMQNMLGNHRRVGVGRSGELWTQMFGD